MERTDAKVFLEVGCKCPYCDAYLDIINECNESELFGNELNAADCNLEIKCCECEKPFIVTDIHY